MQYDDIRNRKVIIVRKISKLEKGKNVAKGTGIKIGSAGGLEAGKNFP